MYICQTIKGNLKTFFKILVYPSKHLGVFDNR